MSTDSTESPNLFDEIDSLILSDTFITWFNTTNEIIAAINPIRVYDVIGGVGIKESRSGGTITLSVDDGPGIKGIDNITTGEKQFTLDFVELPEFTSTDGVANPEDDDIFCVETGVEGTEPILRKVTADSILPPTVKGDHTFTGVTTFQGGITFEDGFITLQGESTEQKLGLEVDLTDDSGDHKQWFYNHDFDAWVSNVSLGVSAAGFISTRTGGGDEAIFTFKAEAEAQKDVVLEFRTGDNIGTEPADAVDSWYIAARGSGTNPHSLEFALEDYEDMGSDDVGYNIVMSLERDDTTATTTHKARFHDKVFFENIVENEQFAQSYTGEAQIIPLTSSDGFLSDTWFNRRTETNYDATGPDGIAVGMAVTYNSAGKLIPAQADSITTANVVGIIETIVGGKAIYNARGDFDGIYGSATLIPGQLYYLDPDVKGGVTPNIPTKTGHCIRPLFMATDSNSGVINIENWGREVDITPRSVAGRVVIVTPNFETVVGANGGPVRAGDVVRFLRDTEVSDNTDNATDTDGAGASTDVATDATANAEVDDLDTNGDDPVRVWESVKIVKASASDFTSSLAIGVVEDIISYKDNDGVVKDHAVVVIRGEISTSAMYTRHGGLDAGGLYYLDDDTTNKGGVSTTPPSEVGTVTKVVMHGMGTNTAFVDIESSNKINGFFKTNTITTTNFEDTTENPMSVGDVVRFQFVDDTDTGEEVAKVVKAKADTPENSQAIGVVARVIDATPKVLQITTFGEEDGLTNLVPATEYFLSSTTAGAVTATRPSGDNSVVRRIGVASGTGDFLVNISGLEAPEARVDLVPDQQKFRTSNFASSIDVGDWVRYEGTQIVRADAFAYENSMVVGVCTEKYTEDSTTYITVVTKGYVNDLYPQAPLTAGFIYYLSASPDSGTLTETLPTATNSIRKRCFIATTTTSGYVDVGESIHLDATERVVFEEQYYTSDLVVGNWVRYESFNVDESSTDDTAISTDGTDAICRDVGSDGKLFYDGEPGTLTNFAITDGFLNHPDLDDLWNYVSTDERDEFNCPCEASEYVDDLVARASANGGPTFDAAGLKAKLLFVPGAHSDAFEYNTGWQNTGFLLSDYLATCGCDTDGSCPDDACEQTSFTITVVTGIKDDNVRYFYPDGPDTDVQFTTDGTEILDSTGTDIVDGTDEIGNVFAIGGVAKKEINIGRNKSYIIYTNMGSSHRFALSTTPDGIHGGGIEYTEGVNHAGSYDDPTKSYIDFDVPVDAPDTLYYYCVNHPKMGGKINITTICTESKVYSRLTKCDVVFKEGNNSSVGSNCVGIVEGFHNNKAVVVTQGKTLPLYSELLPGSLYYLSPEENGQMTRTRPTSPFHYIKPVFVATDSNRGVVNINGDYRLGVKDTDFYLFSNSPSLNVGEVTSIVNGVLFPSYATDTGTPQLYNPLGIVTAKMAWGSTYLFAVRTHGLVSGFSNLGVATGTPLWLATNSANAGGFRVSAPNTVGTVSTRIGTVASATSIVLNIGTPEIIENTVGTSLTYDTAVAGVQQYILTGSTTQRSNRSASNSLNPYVVLTTSSNGKIQIPDGCAAIARGTVQAIAHDGSVAWAANLLQNNVQQYDLAMNIFHDSAEPNKGDDSTDGIDGVGIEKLWMMSAAAVPSSESGWENAKLRSFSLGTVKRSVSTGENTDDAISSDLSFRLELSMDPDRNYDAEYGQNTDGTDVIDNDVYQNNSTHYTGDAFLDIVCSGEDVHNYNFVANIEVTYVYKPADTELTDLPTEPFMGWFPCGAGQGNSTDLTDANSDGCPDSFCTSSALGWCVLSNGNILGGDTGTITCPDCMLSSGIFVLKDADIAPSRSCIQVDTDGTVTIDCPTGTDG